MENLTYGQALSNRRKELGISKKHFAESLNISVYQLSQWEEDIVMPNDKEKEAICSILRTEVKGYKLDKKSDEEFKNNINHKKELEVQKKLEELEVQIKKLQEQLNNSPTCPECGSKNIILGQRGTGFGRKFLLGDWAYIGAKDLWYTCAECGKRWEK